MSPKKLQPQRFKPWAFTDQDDCYPTEDEEGNNNFCAASLNCPRTREQLQQKIQQHVRFLTSLSDAELSAAVGEMELDDGDSEGDSDSDADDGEVVRVKTRTTGI